MFEKITGVLRMRFFKVNLLAFIVISVLMTIICEKFPEKLYNYKRWLFKERGWEDRGRIYERLFGVKKWKSKMPDISDFMKWRFNKKHLAQSNSDYLSVFLVESCKSEFTHWMIILSSFLFIIWSDLTSTIIIFVFAGMLNMPYIIIQRYNRPRLIRLLRKNTVNAFELSIAKI